MKGIEISSFVKPEHQDYLNAVLSEVNDHVIRLSIMTQPYPWHFHPNSDETFIGIEDVVIIETYEGLLELKPGMIVTIPKGVWHCTRPKYGHSKNLTVESAEIQTTFKETT